MIYPNEAFYVVSGFAPRTDLIQNAFNFAIGLDSNFAIKAYEKELPEGSFEILNNQAKEIIKTLGEKSEYIKNPYGFVENDKGNLTALLRWVCVPGDACELYMEGGEVDHIKKTGKVSNDMLIYSPHNIDNRTQAYSLLSCWLNWADSAFAFTRD